MLSEAERWQAYVCLGESVLLGAIVIGLVIRWKALLFSGGKTSEAGQAGLSLRGHLRAGVRQLGWTVVGICGLWLLFYAVTTVAILSKADASSQDVPLVPLSFWCNLLTNAETLTLVWFYLQLTVFENEASSKHYALTLLMGCAWTAAAATVYELLMSVTYFGIEMCVESYDPTFKLIYGLGQAIGLYLVVGRVENIIIMDYIGEHFSKARFMAYRMGIPFGYLYASLQPLYYLFGTSRYPSSEWMLLTLISVALVLKLYVIAWLASLFRHGSSSEMPTPIEHYLYESERFAMEELSSFQRRFMRTHYGQVYAKRHHEREIGYLGVEYSYLNEYKRERLALASRSIGGLLVEEVYPGSAASTEGLRPWDYVTRIGGIPVGRSNRLSELLSGLKPEREVEVTYCRKKEPGRPAMGAADYIEVSCRVRLGRYNELVKSRVPVEAAPMLGVESVHVSALEGVVVHVTQQNGRKATRRGEQLTTRSTVRMRGIRSVLFNRYYETPDIRMLQLAVAQLVPGETVVVDGRAQGPDGESGVEFKQRVRMRCEMSSENDEDEDGSGDRHERTGAGHLRGRMMVGPAIKGTREKILEHYPWRLMESENGSERGETKEWKNLRRDLEATDGLTAMVVDDHMGTVFQYHCDGIGILDELAQLPVWSFIDTGEYHLCVCRSRKQPKSEEYRLGVIAVGTFRHVATDV